MSLSALWRQLGDGFEADGTTRCVVLHSEIPCCLGKGASCRSDDGLSHCEIHDYLRNTKPSLLPLLVTGTGAQRPGCAAERFAIPRGHHKVCDGMLSY
jgi:hypothetical protein